MSRTRGVSLVVVAALLAACSAPRSEPQPVADLRALQWIVGTWRGSGAEQAPFYERYTFADDSTLVVESFKDSTLAQVDETTHFALRGGRLANIPAEEGGTLWVAARLDRDAVTFAPVRRARNSFTWRRGSDTRWTAELSWPATATAPARSRVYEMVRWAVR